MFLRISLVEYKSIDILINIYFFITTYNKRINIIEMNVAKLRLKEHYVFFL